MVRRRDVEVDRGRRGGRRHLTAGSGAGDGGGRRHRHRGRGLQGRGVGHHVRAAGGRRGMGQRRRGDGLVDAGVVAMRQRRRGVVAGGAMGRGVQWVRGRFLSRVG